ncbi:TonB-dependent receptor plug domain-containing protein [Sphingomonas faeni]|uniref:TonB-dependent receptor plug domain-containing protein n=1 Tax=Sphingomonas faeni TaxID=185950 RepID=UPI0020BFC120|nr:TonB-dependent receptor [Sphingomonas faeni]MCK8455652.1 TonB-dependent receptor [Sphingomonas faeni]
MQTYRRRLLATTLFVGAVALAAPAVAQVAPTEAPATDPMATQPPVDQTTAQSAANQTANQTTTDAPQADQAPGDIVVTGSRIASPSATAASPLQSVGITQIQQSGAINVQDVLLQNPAFGTPGVSRTNSSFATQGAGIATVNLRNLGEDRTLVLVNGRRFVSGLPGSNAVDLNVIPTQFLERVDVLTGGASAVYGSDAVAGVVNMIYKTKFDGVQLDGQVGMSQYGDGFDRQINALVGKNFADGRGNIMLFGGYSKQGTVLKRDRFTEAGSSAIDSTSRGAYVTGNDADLFTPERPYLSGFAPQGRYYAGDSTFTYGQDGALRDCVSTNGTDGCINADGTAAGADGFNRSSTRYLAVPVERYVGAGRANFEVSPALNLFIEGNYAKTKVNTVIEPFPLDSTFSNPRNSGQIPIQTVVGGITYRNPYVPDAIFNAATDTNGDGLKDIYFDRRLSDFGPRTSSVTRDVFRIAGGANGKFLDDRFNYEVYGIYGQTKEDQVGSGQFNTANFFQALNSYRDPATGQIVCADPAARAAGCVPANIYGAGALTPAASYLAVPTTLSTKVTQTVAGGNVSGKLFSLFGADPVGFSIGTEYRRESSRNDFDLLTQQGLNGNNALPSTAGRFHLWEGFAEVVAPIIQDRPFFQSLSVRGAIRVSDYSTVGTTYSYNFGGEWAPIDDIRFRVMQARSVRAPNINELFQAPQQDFPSVNDPCIGVTAATTGTLGTTCRAAPGVLANIAANGGTFTANQADVQGVTSFGGGNPNLNEEKGDSFTAGVVINPRSIRALRNLVVTVDYFNIRIKDAIVQTPLQYILNQCYEQGATDYCSQITRRAGPLGPNSAGSLDQLTNSFLNSGGVKTQGIDTVITYRQDLTDIGLAGTLGLRGSYTHLISGYTVPLPDADRDYFAGEIGASRDRFTTNASYDIDGVGLTMTGTWISQASLDDQLTGARPGTNPLYRVRPQFYLDSQIRFQTSDGFEFYVGGSNLLNNKPPYLADIGASGGQDTDAGTYDALGRRYYAGVRINF